MASETTGPPALPRSAPADCGLRCPRCEYNLTGLVEPRCPECGQAFDWEAVRQAADRQPTIAFERGRRWRKVPALVATWATVLFAPWIFARQAMRRVSIGHGLVFGGICFLPVTARYAAEGFDAGYSAWISAAVIYVLAQAALLIVLDPTGWRQPLATFCFWLAIGGYTTAVVVTESIYAAPLMSASVVWDRLQEFATGRLSVGELYDLVDASPRWIGWLQLGLWLAGLGCCYAARLRRRRVAPVVAIPLTLLCLLLLLALYAFCVDPVGYSLFTTYGGGFGF